jgi:hypothetical protein
MAEGAINFKNIQGIFPCAELALQAVHGLSYDVISVLHIRLRCKANLLIAEPSGDLSSPLSGEERGEGEEVVKLRRDG